MQKILFLGCGKMGSAIASSILEAQAKFELNLNLQKAQSIFEITAIDPNNPEIRGLKHFNSLQQIPVDYEAKLVFLCTKPQNSEEIIKNLANSGKISKKTIFVSILAGKKIKFFKDILGKSAKIIRVMPNLGILENQGIIAYLASQNVKEGEKNIVKEIFATSCKMIELQNEKDFDNFTAIFGSGPGYIFYLQEIFENIAKNLGIDEKNAANLVKQLFLGSSSLSKKSPLSFLQLKNNVTSAGGTTEAGLEVLKQNDILQKLLTKAIKSASKRSKELAK
jgi:pyrroline-5-carboxylate reductase